MSWELQRRVYYSVASASEGPAERRWEWGPWFVKKGQASAPLFATRIEGIRYAMQSDLHPTDISEWTDAFVQHHWSKRSRFMGWRIRKVTSTEKP